MNNAGGMENILRDSEATTRGKSRHPGKDANTVELRLLIVVLAGTLEPRFQGW